MHSVPAEAMENKEVVTRVLQTIPMRKGWFNRDQPLSNKDSLIGALQ